MLHLFHRTAPAARPSGLQLCQAFKGLGLGRGPKDHISIRILQKMVSGMPLMLGLGARMSDPYVYVVFWAPIGSQKYLEAPGT